MNEEEKFEDIVRQKFAEKEFVFNEENWEKAEKKLDSSRRSKKIGGWVVIFSIGLVAGIAAMLPFVEIKNDDHITEIAELTRDVPRSNETDEVKAEESNTFQARENGNNISKNEIESEQILPKEENIVSAKPAEAKSKTKQALAIADSENNVPEKKQKQLALTSAQPKKENIKLERSDVIKSSLKEGQALVSKKESQPENVSVEITSDLTKSIEKNKKDSNSESANQQIQPEAPSAQIQLTIQAASQKEIPKDSSNNTSDESALLNQEVVAQIVVKDSTVPESRSSPGSTQSSPAQSSPKRGLASANIFSLEAGVNYALGWNYPDTSEGRGFNPLFGVGFTHYFNPDWSVYSGIQYGSMGHLNVSKKTFSHRRYDFGSSSVDTSVDTKVLYYAVLPIQVQYNFNNRNSIRAGGSVSYLMNTKSNVIINSGNNSGPSAPVQTSELGYYSGAFKKWDAAVSVSYRRKILEKFSVTATAYYGLVDIKSDAFFSRNRFERNAGFKIVIGYDLFQY